MNVNEIKNIIEDFGSDSLKVVGGKFEGGIHLQQIPDEIAPCIFDLLELEKKGNPIKNFLEIGSASGGNAFIFNYFFDLKRIVLIDDNKHRKYKLRKSVLKNVNHEIFIGDSHSQIAGWFIESLGIDFDVLFIDGDHSYEGVKKDEQMYAKFVNQKGFIIFHDTIACSGIHKFINEIDQNPNKDYRLIGEYKSREHSKPCGIRLYQTFNPPFIQ